MVDMAAARKGSCRSCAEEANVLYTAGEHGTVCHIKAIECRWTQHAAAAPSHDGIRGAAAALGHRPPDVLRGVLDVAGLAVQAVLGVDLQVLGAVVARNPFVHAWGRG